MKEYMRKLLDGKSLSREESRELFSTINESPIPQQSAILALLSSKKEDVQEILGIRDVIYGKTEKIDLPIETLDIVGTGGDGKGTLNISTASSIVIASCGVKVAKHGTGSMSGTAGSANTTEYLGIPMPTTKKEIEESLKNNNYTYIFAPLFNPFLKQFSPLRKQIGIPVIFNILGPTLNPLIHRPKSVVGVFRKDLLHKMATILIDTGIKRALVVHSEDGLDEISICAPTNIIEIKNGFIRESILEPPDYGLPYYDIEEIKGGTPSDNAQTILDIFSGKITGAKLDIILINSAAGLYVSGLVNSIEEGIAMARSAISSKKTNEFLTNLTQGGK